MHQIKSGKGKDGGEGGKGKGIRPPKKTPPDLGFTSRGLLWTRDARLRLGVKTAVGLEVGNLEEAKIVGAANSSPIGSARLEVLVNRMSLLGNPYDMKKDEGLRSTVIRAYEEYLNAVMTQPSFSYADVEAIATRHGLPPKQHCGVDWRALYESRGGASGVRMALQELCRLCAEEGQSDQGKDLSNIRLLCHCVPLQCHAQTLAACVADLVAKGVDPKPGLGRLVLEKEEQGVRTRRWNKKVSDDAPMAESCNIASVASSAAKRETQAANRGNSAEQNSPQSCNASTNRLRLDALRRFAVSCSSLVDIGANLGKCSTREIAQQLVRAAASGVDRIILTGTSVKISRQSLAMCEAWSGSGGFSRAKEALNSDASELQTASTILPALYFTAGVHPHDAHSCDSDTLSALRDMAMHQNCVSIGECGLDYDRMFSPRPTQLEWCRRQVELAVELSMPLFIHERDRDVARFEPLGSADDIIDILMGAKVDPERVCIHCFTGSDVVLRRYIEQGYMIGLTGFAGMKKRGEHIRRQLASGLIPLNRLMIETDSPFMMPDKEYLPHEIGLEGRRMEPCAMPAVCNAIAECMGAVPEDVAKQTTANAVKFFCLR